MIFWNNINIEDCILLGCSLQDEMKGMEETLEGIRGEISKLEKEEETLAKENVEVKHELEKYETVIKENTQKMKYWKKEVGNHWIYAVLSSHEQNILL